MRPLLNVLGAFCMLTSTVVHGQWGFKVNLLDADVAENHGKPYVNSSFGLGFDHDLTSKISIGADVSHSWDLETTGWLLPSTASLVESRVTRSYIADDGHTSSVSTRYERSGREVTGWLRAVYLFTGNSSASWYAGPVLGMRYRQEEINLIVTPRTLESADKPPSRLNHRYVLFPIGLRIGLRDEMPNGYLDLHVRVTYEIGGGRHLYDELPTLTTQHAPDAVRSPECYVGLGVAYGFCLAGCGR